MRKARVLFIFQSKIFLPGIILTAIICVGASSLPYADMATTFGFGYLLSSLLCHYFIYEIRNKGEYYFYGNLGFSRLGLWLSTVGIGMGILIISAIV